MMALLATVSTIKFAMNETKNLFSIELHSYNSTVEPSYFKTVNEVSGCYRSLASIERKED